jgi:hypothetical protein
MKKEAVIAKFTELLECAPPDAVPEITAAFEDFMAGNADAADMRLGRTVKRRPRAKKQRVYPGYDPVHIEHNLVDDQTADNVDTNYREFD